MKQGLFQEKAMQQLAAPEQLDQRVRIIPSGAWILFAAVLTGIAAAVMWAFFGTVSSGADYHGVIFDYNDVISLRAQTGGVLGDVLVEEGDTVSRGDVIAVIYNEAALQRIETLRERQKSYAKTSQRYRYLEEKIRGQRGEYMLRSTSDGVVQKILLNGQAVDAGDVVASIVPQDDYSYQEVYIYVPREQIGALAVGMEAQITPSYVTREEYGYVEGIISNIDENIVTENHIVKHMGTLDYVEEILPSQNCVEVTIQLSVKETGDGGYVWSNTKGEALNMKSGDRCRIRIIRQEYHPYELILQKI